MIGVVRHWSDRGYGKIFAGGRTYFVHQTSLVNTLTLAPGQQVVFAAVDTPKGPRAENVQLLEASEKGGADDFERNPRPSRPPSSTPRTCTSSPLR